MREHLFIRHAVFGPAGLHLLAFITVHYTVTLKPPAFVWAGVRFCQYRINVSHQAAFKDWRTGSNYSVGSKICGKVTSSLTVFDPCPREPASHNTSRDLIEAATPDTV